jgi:hypothetical protein
VAEIRVGNERAISAPAARVYRILGNYREHHPRILPPAFSNVRVEEGGVGAGTIIAFRLKLGGRGRDFRQRVDEPEPGKVLTETDLATGAVTTFTVKAEGAEKSRVRIDTRFPSSGGVQGYLERTFAPRMLTKLYADELERLDTYARTVPS